MGNGLKRVDTRFRAFQLGQAGSSFSYFADRHFTMLESVITDINKQTLFDELAICGRKTIDTLHITSWDNDHCSINGLTWILNNLKPRNIEYPGYQHDTDNYRQCLELIKRYQKNQATNRRNVKIQSITPSFISSLFKAKQLGYSDIYYHPHYLSDNSNDNSTVKLFRTGSFNVLSLGDVECEQLSASLRRRPSLKREVDVLILAHHGADNGFTTRNFLEIINPRIAICSSDFGNKHDHPKQTIRNLLSSLDIKLCTTKRGDVVINSTGNHDTHFTVTNLITNSTDYDFQKTYKSKKSNYLSMNQDSIKNLLAPKPPYWKKYGT